MKRWLVFTDLDGTLLDEDYGWEAARPAVEALRAASIPIILNSSKTVAEMAAIRDEMQLDGCCIAENGSVIYTAPLHADVEVLETSIRDELVALAGRLRKVHGYRFEGFSDWQVRDVMQLTGLSRVEATGSMRRQATEPIIWKDTQERLEMFIKQLHEAGVMLVRGGQFWHLMLAQTNKGMAMLEVLDRYQQREPDTLWGTVALGDSPNDWSMLERADVGILIPRTDREVDLGRFPGVRRASFPSAYGWNDAILSWLSEIKEEVECE
ncbi:MAG: mannosyl-3-phosphoglycerate phosphatase [Kiritimatiellaceae bacterium]|jgi:mannosyl-3-phosphoglycerate phosphatase|nr:mannosyl-3-phosphoglycerate phosphatase [Kiritimatiellaceae bacterium]|tara:strand:- start:3404 stop:4204 length:801 start_codon:yes stop_codon:yes gene_type:complete